MKEQTFVFAPTLTEVEVTRVILIIEKLGGDYTRHIHREHATAVAYKSSCGIRSKLIKELDEHHSEIRKKLI